MSNLPPSQQTSEAKIRTMTRKPTLSELQHWKNQGIRIDMPGSPLVGSFDETAAAEALSEPGALNEFQLASQNTAAVAEALDRLMSRTHAKTAAVKPVSAKKGPVEVSPEAASPTVEIDTWEPVAPTPAAEEDEEGFVFVAGDPKVEAAPPEEASPAEPAAKEQPVAATPTMNPAVRNYRQRSLTQPKWEIDSVTWPEEIDMILDLCGDQWKKVSTSLTGSVKSLAVVALGEGCGCTTMTLCLAKLLAEQGRRVLLIDEGKGPDCLTVRLGLDEALPIDPETKVETLYEAVIQAAEQDVAVLPAGYRQLTDLTANQLQQFTHDFDVVLWDGGNRPEVWQRLALVHSVLVVRDARGSHDHELGQILPKLQQRKINVIGVAENFWR